MKLGKILVEGKSKKIYDMENGLGFMVFKPHLRSITSKREENIAGTEHERLIANLGFSNLVESVGIETQFMESNMRIIQGMEGIVVKPVKTIPIEFICRYYAAGSIVRMFPSLVTEGQEFKTPLYKYDFKQDISVNGVDDPMLNESYIVGLGLLTSNEFQTAQYMLKLIGRTIRDFLQSKNIRLIDMKMEFGFDENNNIILIDEISQDCIRANDITTGESLTKDAFRNMKSDEEVLNAYKEFNKRLGFDIY